jgi:hypothetical protein
MYFLSQQTKIPYFLPKNTGFTLFLAEIFFNMMKEPRGREASDRFAEVITKKEGRM